jgi:hypothetical protein
MRKAFLLTLCAVFALSLLSAASFAKNTQGKYENFNFVELPQPAANPPEIGGSMFQAAAAGTTVLGWFQFDTATGQPDAQGWTVTDITAQLKAYFHVDGPLCNGAVAVSGNQSMWCGEWPSSGDPWCGWGTLPGYGNSWSQALVSGDVPVAATLSYTTIWDSEPGYDYTYVQYWDNVNLQWVDIAGVNAGAGAYDGSGGPLVEGPFSTGLASGNTKYRFNFVSDGAWSDEDGLWPTTEGAFKVDDIVVSGVGSEDFEGEACGALGSTDGFWSAVPAPPFGVYGALNSAAAIVQEDPCLRPLSTLWSFFDDPLVTNYACGGFPLQGAMPYGPNVDGLYMNNEIWSPWIPITGNGSQFRIQFLTYRDLPLDNLQFYIWSIRTRDVTGCPTTWDNFNFVYYGGQKDWIRTNFDVGNFVPGGALDVQCSIGAVDQCGVWCGIYGTGACHSHAPVIDQFRLVRVDVQGPQWNVRDIDLWHDNFPEEGGVDPVSSFARCDMAQDILPGTNGSILPGDSLAIEVTDPNGLAADATGGRPGPAVYAFVKVTDRFGNPKAGKNGLAIQSPDFDAYVGDPNSGLLRWPFVTGLAPAGWDAYRMDNCYTSGGGLVADRYCLDLMDLGFGPTGPHYNHLNENSAANVGIFTPGDVINYVLAAQNSLGQWSYLYRTFGGQGAITRTTNLNTALNNAFEWSVLPDAGLEAGDAGDILYVDDADDRGGPAQLYFDWAFQYLNIEDRVDRFDVLGPSSNVGNSLSSRVKNIANQMIGDQVEVYQKVLWNSSDLSSGLMGDGGTPNGGSGSEKSDDYAVAEFFLNNHPDNPGWYAAGDDMASEWATLTGAAAVNVKSVWMTHNLVNGNHVLAGEAVSPVVYQNTGSPIGPVSMYAYGGCAVINDFDVLSATGTAFGAMSYGAVDAANQAVVAQATPNGAGTTARYVLSGFAFNYIRDDGLGGPPDRVEHLRDILQYFQNIIDPPIGIDPVAFSNSLDNAYPNPFNPTTTIKYTIANRGNVSLKIYNAAGQLVRTLVNEVQSPQATAFSKTWNGLNDQGQPVSSGVYFYKLMTTNFTQTKKMVLLK